MQVNKLVSISAAKQKQLIPWMNTQQIHLLVFTLFVVYSLKAVVVSSSVIIVQGDMALCVCRNREMVKTAEVSALERAAGWTPEGDPE